MTYPEGILLGILQGLTEFLPVSSSGHLALVRKILEHYGSAPRNSNLFVELILHVGTLLAITVFFRTELRSLLVDVLTFPRVAAKEGIRVAAQRHPGARTLLMITIVSVITFAVYRIPFVGENARGGFSSFAIIGAGFFVTTLCLTASRFVRPGAKRDYVTLVAAIGLGVVQAIAVFPGVSRSGSTITAGMLMRIDPLLAARFSFLMSIPAVMGGAILEYVDYIEEGVSASVAWGPLGLGFVAAAVSGYAALWVLFKIIGKGRFAFFAPYTLAATAISFYYAFH